MTVMHDVWHVTSTLKRTITKSTLIWVAVLCALRRRFTPGARATSTGLIWTLRWRTVMTNYMARRIWMKRWNLNKLRWRMESMMALRVMYLMTSNFSFGNPAVFADHLVLWQMWSQSLALEWHFQLQYSYVCLDRTRTSGFWVAAWYVLLPPRVQLMFVDLILPCWHCRRLQYSIRTYLKLGRWPKQPR